MKFIASLARIYEARNALHSLCTQSVFFTFLIVTLSALPAQAQQPPIIGKGDAVVTGYSGVALLQPAAGAKPEDYAIINQQGATLQVFDLSQMYGRDDARLVNAGRFFSVTAGKIGQVFGVALDDGANSPGTPKIPNIYATATSVFGLQLVETTNGVRNRARTGGANRAWMDGQFGVGLGGGPGSIWKINGRTGKVSLFANVTLNGFPNAGPALGNIAFDPNSRKLFVSDLQTGMIHSFDLNGAQVAIFDHGASARPRLGLPSVPYNPARSVEITSPAFNASNPATWGYAETARKIWGVGVYGRRLYYSVAEGPEIWSVGIAKNGTFANDARVEVEVQAPSGDPVSDITFAGDGTMYLAQRGAGVSKYDYTEFAKSRTASVLRYRKRKLPSGRVTWQPVPDEYAVGFPQGFRNANGGIALGYGYDRFGFIRYDACKSMLWSTGEQLRQNPQLAAQLTPGGPMIVNGLQGNSSQLAKPANEGPFKSYFIDFDSNFADPTYRGHMGDVAIWSSCRGGIAAPKPPVGPRIRITKSCSSASLGGQMHCRVTLTSTGSKAPKGRVGFSDIAKVLKGPAGGNVNPLIVSGKLDDPDWKCSALPANTLKCSISGSILKPGRSRSVRVIMDISGLTGTNDWRLRNCAKLDGTKITKCVTRGESDAIFVVKSGPDQQPCIAGGPCDFEVTVANPGKRTFDGDLFLGDNLTIGGASVGGINVDSVFPAHGCAIANPQLPLQWQCHMTIPPGGQKTFKILLTIPAGAVPAGVAQGRNCFVATDPNLALQGNALPADFWANMLDPANNAVSSGRACVDFAIQPAPPNQIVPPRVINGLPIPVGPGPVPGPNALATMQMVITASPPFFSNPGEAITFTYKVENTGNVVINTFSIADPKVSPGQPVGNCDRVAIGVGQTATCKAVYVTTAADIGANIVAPATVTGTW